jgi:hypothetical protein
MGRAADGIPKGVPHLIDAETACPLRGLQATAAAAPWSAARLTDRRARTRVS